MTIVLWTLGGLLLGLLLGAVVSFVLYGEITHLSLVIERDATAVGFIVGVTLVARDAWIHR